MSDERLQEIIFYLRADHTNGYGKLDNEIKDLLTAIEERDAENRRLHAQLASYEKVFEDIDEAEYWRERLDEYYAGVMS